MLTLRHLCAATLLGLGVAAVAVKADWPTALFSRSALAQGATPQPAVAGPQGGAVQVTTDTPEYCERLAQQVARDEQARRNVPVQAAELAEEGHHMCATGLIRGGLVRLRRAWLMLRGDTRAPGSP